MQSIWLWLLQMDGMTFHFINRNLQNPIFDLVMPLITDLGAGGFVWLLILFVLAVFGQGKGRKTAFLAITALMLGWLLSDSVLKNLFARPRPFVHFADARLLVPGPKQFSFPSGHSTTAFAPAVAIFRKYKRLGWIALLLAALIAFSRVYVGVHYPLDVLGGIVLGSAVGYLTVQNESRLDKLVVWGKSVVRKVSASSRGNRNH